MGILRTAVILLLLQVGAPPASQHEPSAAKASIEGFVFRSASGEPLARAQVRLVPAFSVEEAGLYRDDNDPDAASPAVFTERDGKFVLKDIEAGSYRVTAERNGYARQVFGQKVVDGPGTIINLQPGQQIQNINFRMVQGGVITGRVRDAAGEPVAGLGVFLLRATYNETGRKSLVQVDARTTDDRGEYRFYWVPAGRYYVRVSQNGQFSFKVSVADRAIVPTYYPGTVDAENASLVEVQPGAELSAIDIVLAQAAGYRIHGRVVDGSSGKPPKIALIRVSPRKPTAFLESEQSQVAQYNPTSGTFEIRDVLPGAHWLIATTQSGFDELLPQDTFAEVRTGTDLFLTVLQNSLGTQVSIDMPSSDLNDVVLTLTRGISIPVRLSIEGQDLSSVKGTDEMRIAIVPASEGNDYRQSTRLNAEGVARIDNVPPAEYRVLADGPAMKDLYAKEILYGRTDVLYDSLVISDQPPATLTVLLSNKGGQIEGNLTDALSQPVSGAEVILIPDQRDRKSLYKHATADHNGYFVFRSLPPGAYKVFSWEALESNAYYDDEVLSRYETRGRPVQIRESSKETVDLRLIPAPKQ